MYSSNLYSNLKSQKKFKSRAGKNCRLEEWMYSALFHLQYHDKVPLSKAPNPQLLPGATA